MLDLAERTKSAVDDNLSTPCIRNARSLLITALAAAHAGDVEAAAELEERGREVATEGYDAILAAPLARLALARGDVGAALALVPPFEQYDLQTWFALPLATARLDVLGAARDRDRLEREARVFLVPGTYVEPFALRALGLVRGDEGMIHQAIDRFDAMKLDWHARETRALL
jgi:hypothetical protein